MQDSCLEECAKRLNESYASLVTSVDRFLYNKLDYIKMQADVIFQGIDIETWIINEEMRQFDKTVNNALGIFHQELIGCISGFRSYPVGYHYDIKNTSGSIIGEVKNKYNTMNSSAKRSVYNTLAEFAKKDTKATCYLIEIIAKRSMNKIWRLNRSSEERRLNRSIEERIRRISVDLFYELATGKPLAFKELCEVLPVVFKSVSGGTTNNVRKSVYEDLKNRASYFGGIEKFIMKDTFRGYKGF